MSWPSVLAGLAGAALLSGWMFWRHRARAAARRLIAASLADPDPRVRRSAIEVMGAQGVGPYAAVLLERAAVEHDDEVRQALARLVARHQWEPADAPHLVALRMWAAGRLAGEPFAPPVVDAGAPSRLRFTAWYRPPEESGVVSVAERLGASAPNGTSASDLWLAPSIRRLTWASPVVVKGPRPPSNDGWRGAFDAEPATRDTILVTGAGGPAGVAVIRHLHARGHKVVGADADPLAVGLFLADDSRAVPRAGDRGFVDAICDLAVLTGASILICTVAEELLALVPEQDDLAAAGLRTWLPSEDAVHRCIDKWRFSRVVDAAGLPAPRTGLASADGVPGPWVVKPRFGRGSRDVHLVDDAAELRWALGRVEQPLVQTRLVGREFTVDTLVDRDGTLVGAVPRWRLETKAGISTKGETFADPALVDAVQELVLALGLTGPANVQGFVGDDGSFGFVEVNPRWSGGLPLSLGAGADLLGEYLRGVLGEQLRPERLRFHPGVTMLRHFDEVIA